jgi:hypothetical protein
VLGTIIGTSQLIKEERGKATVSLVDLIVGDIEFKKSKVGKVKDPKAGSYMLTADNAEQTRNAYKKAKEDRLRQEKELVHRELHPLFHKEEELREHDTKISKGGRTKKKIEGVGRLEYI